MTKPTTKETLNATEVWRDIYEKLKEKGVVFPDDFNGIGAAYGVAVIIKQALDQAHTAGRQERTAEVVEGMEKEAEKGHKGSNPPCDCHQCLKETGYNSALTDIKNHLNQQ